MLCNSILGIHGFLCHFPRAEWAVGWIDPWWRGGNAAPCSSCLIRQRIDLTALPPSPPLSQPWPGFLSTPTHTPAKLTLALNSEGWILIFSLLACRLSQDGQCGRCVWWPRQPCSVCRDNCAGSSCWDCHVQLDPFPCRLCLSCFPALQGCSVPCHTEGRTQHTPPGTRELTPPFLSNSIQRVLVKWAKTKHILLMEQKGQGQNTFKLLDHLSRPKAGL